MRQYVTDITELRLDVRSTITSFDRSGKVVRIKHTTHKCEVDATRQHGNTVDMHFIAKKVNRGASWMLMCADMTLIQAGSSFVAPASRDFFHVVGTSDATTTVDGAPSADASTFEVGPDGFRLAGWRGKEQWVFDSHTFAPQQYKFEAQGFPLTDGKKTLRSFTVDLQFQTVLLPDQKRPFILPKKAVATFSINDNRTVVESEYTPIPVGK